MVCRDRPPQGSEWAVKGREGIPVRVQMEGGPHSSSRGALTSFNVSFSQRCTTHFIIVLPPTYVLSMLWRSVLKYWGTNPNLVVQRKSNSSTAREEMLNRVFESRCGFRFLENVQKPRLQKVILGYQDSIVKSRRLKRRLEALRE